MSEATAPQPLIEPKKKKRTRVVSGVRFPVYSLLDSLEVARAIHDKGGGIASNEQLAVFLRYRGSNNGSYLARVAAARMFDFVMGEGSRLTITPRAQTILMPVYKEQVEQGLLDAFMGVPLYKDVYDEYLGKDLPTPFGMTNALRTRFGVAPSRVDPALRALMESADQAGLFKTKGSRTQLIIPTISRPPTTRDDRRDEPTNDPSEQERDGGGGGGWGGGHLPPATPKTGDELRNEYVSTLIGLLRDKGTKGDIDEALMARIEKLLELGDRETNE